jgi:plastocyanin
MRVRTLGVAAGIATLAIAVPASVNGATRGVTVDNFRFSPRTITVNRGDTVRWTFRRDRAPHNVRGEGGIRSSTVRTGRYSKRFRRRGSFSYRCSLHPNMRGTVRVR